MKKRFIYHFWALLLIFTVSFWLRIDGIQWKDGSHPDEYPIANWLQYRIDHASLHKPYPGGFFTLAKPVYIAVNKINNVFNKISFLTKNDESIAEKDLSTLRFARYFNVTLGALTCCITYLCAWQILFRRWISLLPGLLIAFSSIHIEHSHYAESDIAMAFMLAVTLWLTLKYINTGKLAIYCLAAACAGFTAGTKYMLVVLIFILPVALYSTMRRMNASGVIKKTVSVTVLTVLLFVLGFVIANPNALHYQEFSDKLAVQSARVFGERNGVNCTKESGPGVIPAVHAVSLMKEAGSLGSLWIITIMAGLILASFGPYRKYYPVLITYPLVYLFYYLFLAPWVRSQEMMNFLTPFSILSAVAVCSLGSAISSLAKKTGVAAAIVLSVAVIHGAALNGLAMSSIFRWDETRIQANNWLSMCMDTKLTIGTENYTRPIDINPSFAIKSIHKTEVSGLKYLRDNKVDIMVRNATDGARGLYDPVTGQLGTEFNDNIVEFMSKTVLLKEWAPRLFPDIEATFFSPVIRLYGLNNQEGLNDVRIALTPPCLISETDRHIICPTGSDLGPALTFRVDMNHPREFAIGGTRTPPCYLLISTFERGTMAKVKHPSGSAEINCIPFNTTPYRIMENIENSDGPKLGLIRTEIDKATHMNCVPCFVRPVFDVNCAVRSCLDNGSLAGARSLLDNKTNGLAPELRFELEVRSGNDAQATLLLPKADEYRKSLITALTNNHTLNGIPVFYHDSVARIRNPITAIPNVIKFVTPGAEGAPFTGALNIPVYLTRGLYRITMEVMSRRPDFNSMIILKDPDGVEVASTMITNSSSYIPISFDYTCLRDTQLALHFETMQSAFLAVRGVEISWSESNLISKALSDITIAQADHLIQNGRPSEAVQILDAMPTNAINNIAAKRLRFEAAYATTHDPKIIEATASDLLTVSPSHHKALTALAVYNKEYNDIIVRHTSGKTAEPIRFGSLLELTGYEFMDSDRKLRLIFESLEDNMPPLTASVQYLKRKKLRRIAADRISGARRLNRGERAEVILDISAIRADGLNRQNTFIVIESADAFSPGKLPVDGTAETTVPLSRL